MHARRTLAVCATAVSAAGLAGCGTAAHARYAVTHRRRRTTTVSVAGGSAASDHDAVYEWGQFGGARPGDRAVEHRQAAHLRLSGSPFGIGPVRARPTAVRGIRGTVTQIATSNSDDYALTRDGAVYAWGPGAQGELGNGTRTHLSERAVRVRLPTGVRITELANPMPYNGAMAIARDGTVWAWGNDRARDFCRRRGSLITTPVRVPLRHVALAVGALRHSLYDAGGRIVSCGAGPNGQLGNGTSGPRARTGTPVAVHGLPQGRAIALTSGWGNAGVLMADGRYYDWGYNAEGQVGDGTTQIAPSAVQVHLPGPIRHVFEGGSYANNGQTIAILTDGAVWEWGADGFGQLGATEAGHAARPRRLRVPRGVRFVAVTSGGSTDYGIDRSAQVWAWGNNRVDQLGDGSTLPMRRTPGLDPIRASQVASTAHNVAALAASRPS